jgi:hypothetical protein
MINKKIKFKLNKFINQTRYLESCLVETEDLLEEYQEIFGEEFKYELDLIRQKKTTLDIKKQNDFVKESKNEKDKFDNPNKKKNCADPESNNDEYDIDKEKEIDNIYQILLKKIYRQLAKETHPDKNNGRKTKLFYKIEKSYNNNNLLDLLTIANDFEIDILNELDKVISNLIKKNKRENEENKKENENNNKNINKEDILKELFENFDNDITNKNSKIDHIKKTVAWEWGNTEDEKRKMKIREFLYNMWEFTLEDINYLNNLKSNKK